MKHINFIDFIRLMNTSAFGKTMKNDRKRRNTKLVKANERIHKNVSRPNFDKIKCSSENFLVTELCKTVAKIYKHVY